MNLRELLRQVSHLPWNGNGKWLKTRTPKNNIALFEPVLSKHVTIWADENQQKANVTYARHAANVLPFILQDLDYVLSFNTGMDPVLRKRLSTTRERVLKVRIFDEEKPEHYHQFHKRKGSGG